MASSLSPSSFEESTSSKEDIQELTKNEAVGARIASAATKKGISQSELARISGIPPARISEYWKGQKQPSFARVIAIADALSVSAEWVMMGRKPQRLRLSEIEEADWLELPLYNLHDVDDHSLGNPEATTLVRRDWLSTNVRTTSGLWLTRLLSDYRAADLHEGMIVLCRTVGITELAEGHLCLWRCNGRIVIGRFSVVADVITSIDNKVPNPDRQSHELSISPSQLSNGDDGYHLVGRILSTFMRPI